MKRCAYCAEEIQDAAIVCRFCNRSVDASSVVTQADAAAVLSKPEQHGSGVGRLVLIALGALALALVLSAMISAGRDTTSPAKVGSNTPPLGTLNVTVQYGEGVIQVTNTGSGEAAGRELIVYINGTPPFTYKAIATVPPLSQSARIPLRTFTLKDGTRFNPIATAVTVIWVGGGGYDYRSFNTR